MKDFQGKVACITGAAMGIGRAIADECVHRGMKVVLADINGDALAIAETEIKSRHSLGTVAGAVATHMVVVDVTKTEDIQKLHDETLQVFGKVHLLFSNAGAVGPMTMLAGADAWNWFLKLNLMSVIDGMRLFVPTMINQGEEAHVVATASIYGLHTGHMPYGVTKQAVVATCEAMQMELRNTGVKHVTISALCPSWIDTGIAANMQAYEHTRATTVEGKLMHKVVVQQMKETSAPMSTVVDAFFEGIEQGKHYFHTHPEHSELILQSRVENILQHGKIKDNERYRAFFAKRDASFQRIEKEMRAGISSSKL